MTHFEIPSPLVDALRDAHAVTVLTGAGISAESGVPTFREAQTGLWAQYDPRELATPDAFRHNPRLVWEWYAWRRALVAAAAPNPGHFALATMERLVPEFSLITQNVDSLHQAAGSTKMIELHGNLSRFKCLNREHIVDVWEETDEVPPRCPQCASLLRPDVVWFGENLPPAGWRLAMAASRACQVFLTVGTSALVQPAASLPLEAIQRKALVVEINPVPTALSRYVDISLNGPSGEVLPALVEAVWHGRF